MPPNKTAKNAGQPVLNTLAQKLGHAAGTLTKIAQNMVGTDAAPAKIKGSSKPTIEHGSQAAGKKSKPQARKKSTARKKKAGAKNSGRTARIAAQPGGGTSESRD